MPSINKLFNIILILLAASGVQASSSEIVRVVSRNANSLVVELQPFHLRGSSFASGNQTFHRVEIAGYGVITEPGLPMLPQTGLVIQVPPDASVRAEVLEYTLENLPDLNVAPAPTIEEFTDSDQVQYKYEKKSEIYASDSFWPQKQVEVTSHGRFRGRELVRVQVNPVQYNPVTQMLRVFKTMRIEITYDGGRPARAVGGSKSPGNQQLPQSFILNADTEVAPVTSSRPDMVRPARWYDSQTEYYKIAVEETGMYKLSHEDLTTAGVPVQQSDPAAIKIFHRGEEIPIWISGPNSGAWTADNAIYFYGERHAGDSTYYDFYNDTNIYWLTLTGTPGKRYQMVEAGGPSGQPSPFYRETLHLEQENLFHRANSTSAIDEHEAWIWRYLFPNEQASLQFQTVSLHENVEICSLRVRVVGTTRDPASPDHHVRFYVNSQEVGEVYFDERESVVWEGSFASSLLNPDGNALKILLVPDTGAQVNQIYLDWAEVVFPRTHAAQESQLQFKQEPGGGERDFFLSNFRDEKIAVFDPVGEKMWQPEVRKQSLYRVASAGFDDGNFLRMYADSRFFRFTERGHGLLVLDPESGNVETRSFDTFASAQAADEMVDFVESLSPGTVVLAGILDEGSAQMTEAAYQALESLGSTLTRQVGSRDSWALIGWKGAPSGSVTEVLSMRFDGPAVASDTFTDERAFRYSANFRDAVGMTSFYVAASDSGVKKPLSIELDRTSDLRNSANGADYIIITHDKFMQEAQQLANYRAQHSGLRTTIVDVQDIYDEFNTGVMHPQAIKDFLTVAYSEWQPPAPRYLVLLGDASWDPKQRTPDAVKQNFVPSYGILVADNWYVSLDGPDDVLPDLFVGRIPAETRAQAQVVVQKIMQYEALPFEEWSKKFLFFNGGINSSEQSLFLSQARNLINQHIRPAPLSTRPLEFNKSSNEAITQQFRNAAADEINRGALWVNFLGHAGSSVWDIDIGQPQDWQNTEVFPFMTGMSCHSARFANPVRNSLSETFMLTSMGAAAYWGSTGFGYITQDFYLLDGIFSAVAKDSVRSVGEATTAAKLHVWQRLGNQRRTRAVINQYALIGDPAMRLRLPDKPEFAVRDRDLEFGADLLLTIDSTTTVRSKILNFGLLPTDSVMAKISVTDAEGSNAEIDKFKISPFGQQDSVDALWSLPKIPGEYEVKVALDPDNVFVEEDELNNEAAAMVPVFASDLTLIKPTSFGVVTTTGPKLVSGNSKTANPDLVYYFEVDTTREFSSPMFQRSPPVQQDELVTVWQPQLPLTAIYFWRVRSFDGEQYGPWAIASFTHSSEQTSSPDWMQSSRQLNANARESVAVNSGGARLENRQLIFRVESAGFLDNAHALITVNDEFVGAYFRGHNVAIFDGGDGRLLDFQVFDTFASETAAAGLADFINSAEAGDFVVAAILDEGTASMTEAAYLALENIGSQFARQVGFRDSWAIIGRKGAEVGTVPEVWSSAGEGGVAVSDTVFRFVRTGTMVSPEIGPALQWHTLNVSHEGQLNTEIAVQVLGRNAETGSTDTLMTDLTQTGQTDLSGIDAGRYPQLRLRAELSTEDGVTTPALEQWGVAYAPPPDLVVDNQSLVIERDTLVVGEVLDLQTKIGNFGLAASDSFSIRYFARENGGPEVNLLTKKMPGLTVDEVLSKEVKLDPGTDLSGRVQLFLEVDVEHEIPEINETNNRAATNFWVMSDTAGPDVRITFDGTEIALGEYVSMNPNIMIELRDRGQASFADSALVTVFLDGEKVPYGEGSGQANFIPQNLEQGGLKALVTFQPQLSGGEHEIEILAKDESGNFKVVRTEFSVSESFAITHVMNYPNPFRDDTEFTYNLTQPAEQVKLKIYTVSGRLIQEIEFLPTRVGFNKFKWNGRDADHDILANGVYFYKIIARNGTQQVEVIEKLAVVR